MAAGKFDGREASTSLRAVSPPAEEANATTSKDALGKTFGLEIKSLSVVVFLSLMLLHHVPALERKYQPKTGSSIGFPPATRLQLSSKHFAPVTMSCSLTLLTQ